jgi:hypothetical protein
LASLRAINHRDGIAPQQRIKLFPEQSEVLY